MPEQPTQPPKYLTTAEAADLLRVSTWQVVKACRDGRIRATKPLGIGQWRIAADDLEAAIEKGYEAQDQGAA